MVCYAQSLESVPSSGYEMVGVVSPHSILTVTALELERSPHGGGQRYVTVFLLRIRLLPFPASHPLAKLAIFFCHSLTGTSQHQSLPFGRTAGVSLSFPLREVIGLRR